MKHAMREEAGIAVLALSGDVDMSSSAEARRAMLDCIGGGSGLLVDLTEVGYIDSSGVASLIEAYQLARSRGLRFGLVSVSGAVLRVLELAHLDKIFPLHASVAEAISDGG